VTVPAWLLQRLQAAGGAVPFRTYMQWVLHDPDHGAYGAGHLRIGPSGDFATAPSLGPDFAALLLPQLVEWLQALVEAQPEAPLALVEAGPGEGSLAADLAAGLAAGWPELAARTELVLVEPNAGMAERQRQRLAACPLPCRWSSFEALAAAPVRGVVLAHEVLDALAVERITFDGARWRQQRVALHEGDAAQPSLRLEPGEPLGPEADAALTALGLLPPSPQRPAGWSTELHPELEPWLAACGAALAAGALLVIDYALEAWRYYAPQRSGGTLMAYRGQQASGDPLLEPGSWDLTAHLCIESVEAAAIACGWQPLGQCRQGQAQLALGLAERLHGLQQPVAGGERADLGALLARREALLRLVDPMALGDFRWLAYARGLDRQVAPARPLFLQEPPR
jgi:SAM-dependent MidA family methyltransferase